LTNKGDLLSARLRPGNAHSADGVLDLISPLVERYRSWFKQFWLRGDAAFAGPDLYEFCEKKRITYFIRLPANNSLKKIILPHLKRPAGRPPKGGVQVKVIGKADWHTDIEGKIDAKGICGSGVIDAIAQMFKANIIDKTGMFMMDLDTDRVRKDADGRPEYVLAWADETPIDQDITVTQADVRAVQLAKGALYTGAKLLMQKMGVANLHRIELAGAFGSNIDRESSLTLGMFPVVPIEKVVAVGNAAWDGALMALLNKAKRIEADERARWVEYIEIAIEPAFETEFLRAMHIPHMKDPFPNLKVMLEEQKASIATNIDG
jgi:uncharacterized 2Fe-2S/4Fe-4S cluster protein (DUF4445 family)